MLRLPCCKSINEKLFSAMCEVLQQTQNLRSIHISQSKFQPGQLEQLLDNLDANHGIETIEIFSSALTDDDCRPLATFLESQYTLRSLKLSDNRIGSEGLRYISSALRNAAIRGQMLNSFHIGGNPVSQEALKDALFDLQRLTNIQSLGLRALGISDVESIQPLAEILQSPHTTLTDLQLRRNNLSMNIAVISAGLQENTSLRVLELQECSLSHKEIVILSNGLANNPDSGLRALNISGNNISTESAYYIAQILVSCQKLTTFTAESCGLQTEFIVKLFEAINERLGPNSNNEQIGQDDEKYVVSAQTCKQIALTGLGLSNNNLNDKCAKLLAPLVQSGQLTSLDVSRNKLTDEFVKELGEISYENSRLKHLDLTGNRLGYAGGKNLSEMVKKSQSLIRLFITDCSIPERGLMEIAESLKGNNTLQQMQYGGQSTAQNECGRQLRHQIDERLRRNVNKANKTNEKMLRIQSTDSIASFASSAFNSEAEWSSESIHRVQSMGTYDLMDMEGLAGASVFGRHPGMRRGIGSCGVLAQQEIPLPDTSNEPSQSIASFVFDDEDVPSSSDYDTHHNRMERLRNDFQHPTTINQMADLNTFTDRNNSIYSLQDSLKTNSGLSPTRQNQMIKFQLQSDQSEDNNKEENTKFQVQVHQTQKKRFQLSDNPH